MRRWIRQWCLFGFVLAVPAAAQVDSTPDATRPATRAAPPIPGRISTEPTIYLREHGFEGEPVSPTPDGGADSRRGTEADHGGVAPEPTRRNLSDNSDLAKAARNAFRDVKVESDDRRIIGGVVATLGSFLVLFVGVLLMTARRKKR